MVPIQDTPADSLSLLQNSPDRGFSITGVNESETSRNKSTLCDESRPFNSLSGNLELKKFPQYGGMLDYV